MSKSPAQPSLGRRRLRGVTFATGALGLLLLAGAPSVHAEEPAEESGVRYKLKTKKVQTKATLDTKFKAAKAESDRSKGKKVQMMSGADFAKQRAAIAREIADKQIEMAKRLIQTTEKTEAEYPDLLYRLANHYLDKKAYFELQSGALYEQIYDAQQQKKSALVSQLTEKQKKFEAEMKAASESAVKVFKVLSSDAALSKYKRMDEALYFYAFELSELKREAEMKETYLRLIREYPQSQYIANAYLSFADYYFAQNKIADALKLYEKIVTAYKDSPVYAYALYKMAWCYLNPSGTAEPEYAQSLQKFVETITATLQGRAGSEENAKSLRRDARRDLIKAFIHAGKPSKAWEFFQKWGEGPKKDEDMSRKMMELLANAYFGEGMYVESTAVYKKLQELFAQDELVCDWQGRIVVNALATDDKEIQWKETERLGQFWSTYKDSKFSQASKKKCRDETLDTMKQMATVWHDEADKTRRNETYALAERAYKGFLDTFPKDKDAYEMNFYYAEIVWQQAENAYNTKDAATREAGRKKFKDARDVFIQVLERDPKGKYTQDCAYAQMLAMKNYLEYDETGGQSKACKTNTEGVCIYKDKAKVKKVKATKDTQTDAATDYPESPYTEDESQMIESYDVYQKYVKDPKDKELPKIMYHRAKLMMIHNKLGEAYPLVGEIVDKFDGTIYAAWASEMLMDILTIRWTDKANNLEQTVKASDELEKWSKKLMGMKVWRHEEADRVREAVPTLLAGIGWKKGMAYQEAGKAGDPEGYVKCAEQFVGVFNEHEDHDKADTLLFNAARCYEAAYLIGQTIKMRNILLERFPNSQHAQLTLHEVAQNYQAVAFFDKAAERYEAYAAKYPKATETKDALQNAALFRLGLGNNEKADEDLSKYEELFKRKDPKIAAKIFWSRHDLLKTPEEKLAHAREYLKTYGASGGKARQIVAEAEIGQILWRRSCPQGATYDSCLTIQRQKATAGAGKREKARQLRRKVADKKAKKQDIPKNCGAATQGIITVNARDKKSAAEAQLHFANVLKLVGKGAVDIDKDDVKLQEDFKNAWAMSMVYKADQQYESYLTVEMPEGLDFVVEDWKKDAGLPKYEKEYKEQVKKRDESIKKFKEFFTKKDKNASELADQYGKVKDTKSPAWMLAAAARSAVVSQNFADQLYRAEVPRDFKTEDQAFAYCDALAEQAEPLQTRALDAFNYCLQRSTEFQFFNTFSRMCEEELQQREPDKFPATNELFGRSIYTDSQLDRVGVQTGLEGDKKAPDKAKPPAAPAKTEEKKEEGEKEEGDEPANEPAG